MKHAFEQHTNCARLFCAICDGNLKICGICRGIRGAYLTSECPGVPLSKNRIEEVSRGEADYKNNQWIRPATDVHYGLFRRLLRG
jgi:hypothetical protein